MARKPDMPKSGWVRLWRKSLQSAAFQDPQLWKVWTWCLLKVTHETTWVPITTGRGTHVLKLEPGQFICGRKSAAKELKMKPSSVRNRIEILKKHGNVDTQSGAQYSIVTVRNWKTYQPREVHELGQCGQPKDNERTTKGQRKDTFNNNKNNKNKKKQPPFIPPSDFSVLLKDHPKLDTPAFREAWSLWVEHRDDKSKPLTEKAVGLQLKNLAAAGPSQAVEIIEYSVMNGYEGLIFDRPPRRSKRHEAPPDVHERRRDSWQQLRAAAPSSMPHSQIDELLGNIGKGDATLEGEVARLKEMPK